MINTRNEDIIRKYFDLVQEEIKRLISQDTEIKPNEVELFNDQIFNQPEEIQSEIRQYIDKATMNNLDIKKVAEIIYDKFKLQVKNNVFNQDDINDVPNNLLGERKFIKTFENFILEKISDRKPAKEGLLNSHLPKEMKEKILQYITSNSYYLNKKVMDLQVPKVKGKSFYGVSLGADKNGFFVYTHRARSKSYESPDTIPNKSIKFIESTG